MKKTFIKTIKTKVLALLCALTMLAGIVSVPTSAKAADGLSFSIITSNSVFVDWSAARDYFNSEYKTIVDYSVYAWWAGIPTELDVPKLEHTTATCGTISGLPSDTGIIITVYIHYYNNDNPSVIDYESHFDEFTTLPGVGNASGTAVDPTAGGTAPGTTTEPAPAPAPTPAPATTPEPAPVVTLSAPQVAGIVMKGSNIGAAITNVGSYGSVVQLFTASGRYVDQTTTYDGAAYFYNVAQNNTYYVLAYNMDLYGNYSAASNAAYCMAQPKITSGSHNIKKHSVKLKWNKVTGAKKYTVYAKKRYSSKWVKITTTKKNTYTLKKIKGKTINCYNNDYTIKVVASGNNLKSDDSCYIYTYRY